MSDTYKHKGKAKLRQGIFKWDECPFYSPKRNKDNKPYKKALLSFYRYLSEYAYERHLRNKKREKIIEKEFKNELKNYDTRKNNKGF